MAQLAQNTGEGPLEEAPETHAGHSAAELVGQASRYVALLAAWIATCGSLFMSQVLHWIPCELCWFQRILMYPLAVITTVGILRRDRGMHLYALPLAIVGAGVALYHHLLVKTFWFPVPACTTAVPCNIDYLNWMGVVTIPLLALTAFLIIIVSMVVWARLGSVAASDDLAPQSRTTEALSVAAVIILTVLAFTIASRFVPATPAIH